MKRRKLDLDITPIDFDFDLIPIGDERDKEENTQKTPNSWDKCECGSEKTGQPLHSSWCPRYVPNPYTPKK